MASPLFPRDEKLTFLHIEDTLRVVRNKLEAGDNIGARDLVGKMIAELKKADPVVLIGPMGPPPIWAKGNCAVGDTN